MKCYKLKEITGSETLKKRAELEIDNILSDVRVIIQEVKEKGDDAVLDYTNTFDSDVITKDELRVTSSEISEAKRMLDTAVLNALEHAAANIKKFHEAQVPKSIWFTEIDDGILAGEKITPINDVGLYVPGGKGLFPSVMLMLGIPANVAGVKEIIVCTPPKADGTIDPALLTAADICGIRDIFKVGGAQAIAAMAYGTRTIPKVSKIVGPGSGYIAAAKRVLYGVVDVGLPAGPSEAIILADESAEPAIAASDLLIEAEHGPDSAALLVTNSERLASAVQERIPEILEKIPEWRRRNCETVLSKFGGIIVAESIEAGIDFINDYAPEHLEILVRNPFAVLQKINNAGEILLGQYTPISAGNYAIGHNAILPTGGFAKTYSSVSVFDFLKRSAIGYVTADGFTKLANTVETLAEYEQFYTHAYAIKQRRKERSDE